MAVRHRLPGVKLVEPHRMRPRLHYELMACGLAGHALIGIDARHLSEDALLAREIDAGIAACAVIRGSPCIRPTPPQVSTLPPARRSIFP